MKTLLIIAAITLGGLVLSHDYCSAGSCFSSKANNVAGQSGISQITYAAYMENTDTGRVSTVKLKVTGMDCSGCANFIHKTLSATKGIISDEVNYPGNITIVKYDAAKISDKKIVTIINKLGYKAEIVKSL
ncbi:MAG: heavy-metal-associated domain-containing protein [Chitinophagaceae bacterium]